MGPVGNERRLEGRELEREVETNLKEIGGDEKSRVNRHAILPFELTGQYFGHSFAVRLVLSQSQIQRIKTKCEKLDKKGFSERVDDRSGCCYSCM